ncbi:MAG: GNAT family N-acetyltransferase [Pseudomonadales bacterium]|nr:GNAT family N-acetyltransferase [Pseudomonadales bacterium]
MALIEPETDRLLLRQWRDSDKEPFSTLNADPRVMEYFPSLLSRSESDSVADRCKSLIADKGWGLWAAELKESKLFIGFVGLHIPSDDLPFSPCVEIGWRLAYEHWGKGYATEAALTALNVGFQQLLLDEIVSFTTLSNFKSQAVMKRIGMAMTETFEHPALPKGSPLRKHCLYRLTGTQYAA